METFYITDHNTADEIDKVTDKWYNIITNAMTRNIPSTEEKKNN